MTPSASTDDETHRAAITIARRCVFIVQACLREEEVIDAVDEFYSVIREELEQWKLAGKA